MALERALGIIVVHGVALARPLPAPGRLRLFVTPGTLLRRHADLVRRCWTFKRRRQGRPATRPRHVEQFLTMVDKANTKQAYTIALRALARELDTWAP
ncbi:hypothetical protein GCM10020216_035400 [Nonomuraea helvata]